MTDNDRIVDYSVRPELLDGTRCDAPPTVHQVVAIEVDDAAVRCAKGDCWQDYPPGG